MRPLAPPVSTPGRDRALERAAGEVWDLLVVGGGITGVAVARDAALRGLSTLLVERSDLAAGTSSRSSRLVHGGLRYLAMADFALVREGLVERKLLLDGAEGLVRAVEFLYPVFAGDPDPLWKVNLGVGLYELLSLGYGLGGKRLLSEAEVAAAAPGLRRDGLKGGLLYRDAATHDARLTLTVALSARAAGATLVTRCEAAGLLTGRGRVHGARLRDVVSGAGIEARARAVALCCGPWQELYGDAPVRLGTARGSHLSFPAERLPVSRFLALRSPRDGRLAFAMPVDGYTVVGTTDDFDEVEPGAVAPTPGDTAYLLEVANHAFPAADLEAADVVGLWAGLRPLVMESADAAAGQLSRRHAVAAVRPGLWILTGGKLTTHRAMAEELLDRMLPALERGGRTAGPCRTRDRPLLPGSPAASRTELAELGVPAARIGELERLYGARLQTLADTLTAQRPETPCPEETLAAAQLEMAVRDEEALALDDVLLRRVGPGALDLVACRRQAADAAEEAGQALGWTDRQRDAQASGFRAAAAAELEGAGVPLDGR
ncbi:MAG: glycerol-3-phosphate dehydrogenase/oxidase [Thermoanaerobaculia bacterium]|nr:glycerol-3-phosphate dehydrogenase/oxidase [Thermoanaerobaculia bacterium]